MHEVTVGSARPAQITESTSGIVRMIRQNRPINRNSIKQDLERAGLRKRICLRGAFAKGRCFDQQTDAITILQIGRGNRYPPLEKSAARTVTRAGALGLFAAGRVTAPFGCAPGVRLQRQNGATFLLFSPVEAAVDIKLDIVACDQCAVSNKRPDPESA